MGKYFKGGEGKKSWEISNLSLHRFLENVPTAPPHMDMKFPPPLRVKRESSPPVTESLIRGTSGRRGAVSLFIPVAPEKKSATFTSQKHYLESELSGTNSGLHNSFRKPPDTILLNCMMLLAPLPVLSHRVTDWTLNPLWGLTVRFLLSWTVKFQCPSTPRPVSS